MSFSISRSIDIAAPAQRVHALIDDLRRWEQWSPWEDLDPNMHHEYSGADHGIGARHAWRGNKKAGEGAMEIVGSTPNRIDLALSFLKPWKATNNVSIDITGTAKASADGAAGEVSQVTWTMSGEQNAISRIFFTVFSMDRRLGADFEKGLARLKALAESGR